MTAIMAKIQATMVMVGKTRHSSFTFNSNGHRQTTTHMMLPNIILMVPKDMMRVEVVMFETVPMAMKVEELLLR